MATIQIDRLPDRSNSHVAFKIAEEEFDMRSARIRELGLDVPEGEDGSTYFHDEDNHLFELHTVTLQDRFDRHGSAS